MGLVPELITAVKVAKLLGLSAGSLHWPTKIEQLSRTNHTSTSGIEIVKRFYVEPYEAFTAVTLCLQGFTAHGLRSLPCRDSYLHNCYCAETRTDFAHEDAMASDESKAWSGVGSFKQILEGRHPAEPGEAGELPVPERWQPETTERGTAGAIVEAHYRPLTTCWRPKEPEDPNDEGPSDNERKFDWLDLRIRPGVRQIPWPRGLYIQAKQFIVDRDVNIPDDVANPIGVPVDDISIRRSLIETPPWKAIETCANSVNRKHFPISDRDREGKVIGTIERFPWSYARTLKFVGADTSERFDALGRVSFDLTYHFKRIVQWSDRLFDIHGNKTKGWVTWNHVFMRPRFAPVGWYEVFLAEDKKVLDVVIPDMWPGTQLHAGRLFNEADFNSLFEEQ